MDKPSIISSSEAEDAKIINAFFRGQPLLLQSDMNNDNLNTIYSHIKYDTLDISQPNANHGILTVDEPTSEEISSHIFNSHLPTRKTNFGKVSI